jgi:hypothetical protein
VRGAGLEKKRQSKLPNVRRRLLTVLSLLSLLLCVMVCALWMWSFQRKLSCQWGKEGGPYIGVVFGNGRIYMLTIVLHWPSDEHFRFMTYPKGDRSSAPGVILSQRGGEYEQWHVAGLSGQRGSLRTNVDEAGKVKHVRLVDDRRHELQSPLLPFWRVEGAPFWPVAIVTAFVPLFRLTAYFCRYVVRRKRRLRGRCPGCGYDLRGTPQRCPECGTVPTG